MHKQIKTLETLTGVDIGLFILGHTTPHRISWSNAKEIKDEHPK
jgi:hypothetical protein